MSSSSIANSPDQSRSLLRVRRLGLCEYEPVWHAMQDFTDRRDEDTIDELWLVQHPPVFTQGQAGKAEHVLAPGDIPVIGTRIGAR
jgi:lipoyl(octanoyl) transferase